MTSLHRVLIVEDHAPFRRVIRELVQQRPDVLVVGEAADGPDAIRQAETLRPDVVTLDIGLPGLNGIEVATRLRAVVPDAKLMFLTVESSSEFVEQAFTRGAHGYAYKPRAERDVLPVLDAIIRGARFVSGGLERIARGDSLAAHRHHVLFSRSNAVLVGAFSRFIRGALDEGAAVVVAVAEAHDESLRGSLREWNVDLDLAIREKRYIPVNIGNLLGEVMVDGWPDPARFHNAAADLIAEIARCAAGRHAKVAACGECAPSLWAQGHVEAAIQLEHLWDGLSESSQMDILCAYPVSARDERAQAVRSLCAEHTAVEIS